MLSDLEKVLLREKAVKDIQRLRDTCEKTYEAPISDEELTAHIQITLAQSRNKMLEQELRFRSIEDLQLYLQILNPPKPELRVMPITSGVTNGRSGKPAPSSNRKPQGA